MRKTELKSVESVETIDPRTIRLRLARPDAPLLAVLADRAGITLSSGSFADGGRPELPVCAGPFRVVRRVAQDVVELERFAGYWNAPAIHFATGFRTGASTACRRSTGCLHAHGP